MVSVDIKSLFSNIPLHETIDNCINDLLSNDTVHKFIKEDRKEPL